MTEPSKPPSPIAALLTRAHLGWLSGIGAALALVWGFGNNTFDVASKVCKIGGEASALSDACGAAHLGDRPTKTERIAWADRPRRSCAALRRHLTRFPDGVYAGEAARLITARTLTPADTWVAEIRSLPLSGESSAPTLAAARALALEAAQPVADSRCRAFGAGTLFRFISAAPRAETWTCAPGGRGAACAFIGLADCSLWVSHPADRESC